MDAGNFRNLTHRFFMKHHEDFNSNLNLNVLIPKLNSKELLTSDEMEQLSSVYATTGHKIKLFVQIMCRKGDQAPNLFLQCLRSATDHLPHSDLVDKMEEWLQENSSFTDTPTTPSSEARQDIASHLPVRKESGCQQPDDPSCPNTPLHNEVSREPLASPVQESTVSAQVNRVEPSAPQQESSNSPRDMDHSNIADNFLQKLNEAPRQYVSLIQNLAAQLESKDVSIDTLVRQLNGYLDGITIPSEAVRDFLSLCGYLRMYGLCHEADVDLLCKFFTDLGHEDLNSKIHDYAQQITEQRALNYHYRSTPSPAHYLLLTFHRDTEMSLGQASQVKDTIAELLRIPRHIFTLASTRPGSIILVWRVPMPFLKNASNLSSEETKSQLHRNQSIQSIEMEYVEGGGVRHEQVYSKKEMVSDPNISSSTNESSTGIKRGSPPPCDDPQLGPSSSSRPRRSSSGPQSPSVAFSLPQSRHKRPPPLSPDTSCPPSVRPRISSPRQSPGEFARQYILASFEESSPLSDTEQSHPPPFSSSRQSSHAEDPPLQVFADTLRSSFRNKDLFKKAAGPSTKPRFINLALIEKKSVSQIDRDKDEFLKSTLHGTVEDIVKKKKGIDFERIFAYSEEGSRKLVLVEGAPGVGKTMLALKLCQMWANGKLLNQEYDLIMLVTLRRFQGKSSVKIKDIVNISLEGEISDQCTKALLQSRGERTLIILEGWDELPPELREEGSFFFDLIEGRKLPDASILVTSRPTVTADLYDYMDERHIEVLGFNSEQIIEYVRVHSQDEKMAEAINNHLRKFPNLKALAHIPLTLSIICDVAKKKHDLPHTLTELYVQYICITLFFTLKKQHNRELKWLLGLSDLDDLPDEVRGMVQSLSTLALNGFKHKKFVFSKKDLLEVGLDLRTRTGKAFDGYGLLNTPNNPTVAGFEQDFQFNHLSIQEFLAAYAIRKLEHERRVSLLREFRKDKQFQNIWMFFSGITKLEDEDFRKIVIAETGKANKDQIFLLHCLYEANNPVISQDAAEKMYRVLNLNNMFLNTTDCLCAAHMITSAGGEWKVDLRGCNIGEEGLGIISSSLLSYVEEHGVDSFTITSFNLTQNRLKASSLVQLAGMLTSNMHLQGLLLPSNSFGDEGIEILARALKVNKTVKGLHFSSCGLTEAGAVKLAEVLEVNSTITDIFLGFEPIGCVGVTRLALALERNETLTELSLSKTEMKSSGLVALTKMAEVNHTLQVLRLDRNDLGAADCELVASIIEKNTSLILIDLSKNPIGDEGFEILLEALAAKPDSALKKLGAFGCELTKKGLKKLPKMFSVTRTFIGIQLGCNQLGDEGAGIVGEALLQNSRGANTVKQVLLETTGVSDEGKRKLEKICDSINSERDSDNKLDVNYRHHAQVVEKRNSTNYL